MKVTDVEKCKFYDNNLGRKNGKACTLKGRCQPFYYETDCDTFASILDKEAKEEELDIKENSNNLHKVGEMTAKERKTVLYCYKLSYAQFKLVKNNYLGMYFYIPFFYFFC